MATYSMKKGGKEVGPASTYAEPHTMTGADMNIDAHVKAHNAKDNVAEINMSVNGYKSKPYAEPKTTGIKARGTGAATKGLMARGPMA
jgi:hypothetical protein